jgi:hypothetical protein
MRMWSAPTAPDGDSPAFPLVRASVEPPAGIEPATPSLPSMRGGFTTPCSPSRTHTIAQVRGAAGSWVVGRREVARSAVSGKSLARDQHGRSMARASGHRPTSSTLATGTSGAHRCPQMYSLRRHVMAAGWSDPAQSQGVRSGPASGGQVILGSADRPSNNAHHPLPSIPH